MAKDLKKSINKIKGSRELKLMVDTAMNEMDNMTNALTAGGMNEADARLKVQQLYFKNMETFSDPVLASVSILAELKTRIDLDRAINPDQDLVGGKYIELLDQMRKTIKLVGEMKGKTITHKVMADDDTAMTSVDFIDVD